MLCKCHNFLLRMVKVWQGTWFSSRESGNLQLCVVEIVDILYNYFTTIRELEFIHITLQSYLCNVTQSLKRVPSIKCISFQK